VSKWQIITGDCRVVMDELEEDSIDAVICDPPYGIDFMNRGWDHGVPTSEYWNAALHVAKPGAHIAAFGGTRMFHRLACEIEGAGWIIRDCLMWLYGSGFPKSHNLKDEWQGWGTALKPAWEPIILARKPFKGSVASNVIEHGTGAINVDGCRVEGIKPQVTQGVNSNPSSFGVANARRVSGDPTEGRWPANLILDPESAAMLDEQGGALESGYMRPTKTFAKRDIYGDDSGSGFTTIETYGDKGGASRFFYCAKASGEEREAGLDAEPQKVNDGRAIENDTAYQRGSTKRRNIHPTVKPIDLMRYLVRLVTPPNGLVLDPFSGSGSTIVAARLEGFDAIGIEINEQYAEIARKRVANAGERAGNVNKQDLDTLGSKPVQIGLFGDIEE
jgi:site-specific DNA-methyltransferase (adenine-specific)